MKSCVEWRKSFKYKDQVDQFNIQYKTNKDQQLIVFLDTYAEKTRINIFLDYFTQDDDIYLLKRINQLGKYNIAIYFPKNHPKYKSLKETGIKYYFADLVTDWDTLFYAKNQGVSDIFISGELAFDLERVRKMTEGIQLRCFVNFCQSNYKNNPENEQGLKTFFIRPEDIQIYEKYIDIIEFQDSVKKQNTLFEIYFHDKAWDGDLRFLIQGLERKIHNYYLLGTQFGETRISCKRKCQKGQYCRMCNLTAELADSLEKSKVYEVYREV